MTPRFAHRFLPQAVGLAVAVLGLSASAWGATHSEGQTSEDSEFGYGRVEIRLAGFGPQAKFEGVTAVLLPFEPTPADDPRQAEQVFEAKVGSGGRITFDLDLPGLYEVRLLDALGMSVSQGEDPRYVSIVPNAQCSYAIPCHPLSAVTGLVVNASDDSPISGVTLRVDPRFRSAGDPSKYVVTNSEGRYRVLTVRTDVVAIDAPGQQTINMRFGPGEEAGTLRMRPMKRYRSIQVAKAPLAARPDGAQEPRFHAASQLGGGVTSLAVQPDRAVLEFPTYDQGWLDWPLAEADGESVRLLQRLLVRRGGGRMKLDLAEVGTKRVELTVADSAEGLRHARLVAPQTRRLVVISDDDSAPWRLSTPTAAPPEESRDAELLSTLICDWTRGSSSFHVPSGPAAARALPELSVSPVKLPGTRATCRWDMVHEGTWTSFRKVTAMTAKDTFLPVAGDGPVLVSSDLIRGDATETPHDGHEFASCELRITSGDRPLQGLAVRIVPAGCAASDRALDLLGETPLISDANGLIPLRRFLPGDYELRIEAALSAPALRDRELDQSTLSLAAGQNDPIDVAAGG